MKLSYKQRLFFWFGIILLLFTAAIALFEQSRVRRYKTEVLVKELDAYAGIVGEALARNVPLDSLRALFPSEIRITVIDEEGNALYDNIYLHASQMENHALRQEVADARETGRGISIRRSATTGTEYLYYALSATDRYVRVALPYDIQVRRFLRADNEFLYFTLFLFLTAILFINFAAGRFGKSISRLRDFAVAADEDALRDSDVVFPDDELGKIGERIVQGYRALESSKKRTAQEREKLLQHIYSSEEGVCFYTPDGEVEFYNGLFMRYLNILSDETAVQPDKILDSDVFAEVRTFVSSRSKGNYYETVIGKHGKRFSVQTNIFADGSFEMIIRDITKQERTRRLKSEMTGNIAHELRTPVTSIRGYLETILEQPLDAETQRKFITKAYTQTISLSELIGDMGLLTRIKDASGSFRMEGVDILSVVERVCEDMEIPLRTNGTSVDVKIPSGTIVKGDEDLLYSIFSNLTDNAIKYAGKGAIINIACYNSDSDYHYFSFSDTGVGIPDECHLERIFERFYRVSEGRTRDAGGSGLGLSIVRNAIAFHKGTISVKNRAGGGLEFLFQLPKFKGVF